jgi:hypothetical protein
MRGHRQESKEGTLPLIFYTTPLVPRAIILLEKARADDDYDDCYISGAEAAYGFPSDAEVSSSRQATYTTSGQTIGCCLRLFDCLDTAFARAGKAPKTSYRRAGDNIVTRMHGQSRASVQRLVEVNDDVKRMVYPVAEALYGIMRGGGPATAAMRQTVANTPHLETEPVVMGKRKRDAADRAVDRANATNIRRHKHGGDGGGGRWWFW